MQLGMLAASAQTNIYLFTGSKTNITLPSGIDYITAYGATGGGSNGGLGVEWKANSFLNHRDSHSLGGRWRGGGGSYADGGGGSLLLMAARHLSSQAAAAAAGAAAS